MEKIYITVLDEEFVGAKSKEKIGKAIANNECRSNFGYYVDGLYDLSESFESLKEDEVLEITIKKMKVVKSIKISEPNTN